MSDYSTGLKDWGSTGLVQPDNYYYAEGEAPVDEWDNYVTDNIVKDLNHLIDLTNKRIESASGATGSEPSSPEQGELFYETDNEVLKTWNPSEGSWNKLIHEDQSGNVEIPSGGLTISSGTNEQFNISVDDSQSGYSAKYIGYYTDGDSPESRSGYLGFGGANTTFNLRNETGGRIEIGTKTYGNSLSVYDSGNVNIPNGFLTVGGDLQLTSNALRSTYDYAKLGTGGSGSGKWAIRDEANNQDIATFEEGGNVKIPSGDLSLQGVITSSSTTALRSDSGAYVDFDYDDSGSEKFAVRSGSSTESYLEVNKEGNVDVPKGNLKVANRLDVGVNTASTDEDILLSANANISSESSLYNLVNSSSGSIRFGFGNTVRSNVSYTLDLHGDGRVVIPNGQLDVQSGNIGFPTYSSTGGVPALNEGETVYVNGDGLYVEDGT